MSKPSARIFIACVLFFLITVVILALLVFGIAKVIAPAEASAEPCATAECPDAQPTVPSNILYGISGSADSPDERTALSFDPIAPSREVPSHDYSSAVPELLQDPEMPAGCEVYSLTAVLQALGFDADPHAIAREHLPYTVVDNDPASAYSGSPYVDGEVLPPAMVRAGNSYLQPNGSNYRFVDSLGAPFEELVEQSNEGFPVLVWTTVGQADPGFAEPLQRYTFYSLEHCVVLLGSHEDGTMRIMDPQVGHTTVDAQGFQRIYELCGSMAVTLEGDHVS